VVVASPNVNTGIHGYRTPGVRSSGVGGSIQGTESSRGLFDRLLGGVSTTPSTRPPLVDRVLDSYRRLRNGNKRLSQEDKLRLDQHIDSVAELQRRLSTTVSPACQIPPRPSVDNGSLRPMDGNPTKNVQFFTMINEVLAIALSCGTTRVVTHTIDENNQGLTFTSQPAQGEYWHENVAHRGDAASLELVRQFNQGFFAGVFMDLVNRLNNISDGMGGTVLDHSLVCWGQESGNWIHEAFSMPVITAGSAGGAIKTGSYCDYRNLARRRSPVDDEPKYAGLVYNQWLTTALQAMGVPRSEWEETSHPGYGSRPAYMTTTYTDAMWQRTAEILPWLA
jgi:hypothetical protein